MSVDDPYAVSPAQEARAVPEMETGLKRADAEAHQHFILLRRWDDLYRDIEEEFGSADPPQEWDPEADEEWFHLPPQKRCKRRQTQTDCPD